MMMIASARAILTQADQKMSFEITYFFVLKKNYIIYFLNEPRLL